jgi:hypothetical protein
VLKNLKENEKMIDTSRASLAHSGALVSSAHPSDIQGLELNNKNNIGSLRGNRITDKKKFFPTSWIFEKNFRRPVP